MATPRLFPPAALVILGVVLAAVLFALRPSKEGLQDRIAATEPDQLSLTYLELAVADEPDDSRLRLLLARQYYWLGRQRDALLTLDPLLLASEGAASPDRRRARQLRDEIIGFRPARGIAVTSDAQVTGTNAAVAPTPVVEAAGANRTSPPVASGDEAAVLVRQLAEALAAGEVERALPLARRLVALRPADRRAREKLAQVADWAGRPLIALQQWAWLARRYRSARYSERAIALARANWDQELVLELTLRKARSHQLTTAETLELAELHGRLGQIDEARAVLERALKANPEHRPSWDALRELYRSSDNLSGEIAVWQEIHRRFGTNKSEVRTWAELLWRADHPERALAVLERAHGSSAPQAVNTATPAFIHGRTSPASRSSIDSETVRLMAELAWQIEELGKARAAYQLLWKRGQLRAGEIDRLLALASSAGDIDLALAVAEACWREHGRPAMLLRAMQIAIAAERWNDVDRLITASEKKLGGLADMETYWRLRSARYQHSVVAALNRDDLEAAQQSLAELGGELELAARHSKRFANHDDFRKLWQELHRQQLHVAWQRRDTATVQHLLNSASGLRTTVEYWQIRLQLGQRRLGTAVGKGDYAAARDILSELMKTVDAAEKRGFARPELRAEIKRQRFYVAFARGDLDTVRELLDEIEIPAHDRVAALRRLGHDDRAAAVATAAAEQLHDPAARARLDAQLDEIAESHPRTLQGHTRLSEVDGQTAIEVGMAARYSLGTLGLGASMRARGFETPVAVEDTAEEAEFRVMGEIRSRTSVTEIGLGGNLRRDRSLAQLDVAHTRHIGSAATAKLTAGRNQSNHESGLLDALTVRDRAALHLSLDLGGNVFATGRVVAQRYLTRDRFLLGRGFDAEVNLGYRFAYRQHNLHLRLAGSTITHSGLVADCCDSAPELGRELAADSHLIAVAGGISRGFPGLAGSPLRRLHYSVEVMGGWSMPDDRLACAVAASVGLPVLGEGELGISVDFSNALALSTGFPPSRARKSVMIRYAHSLWP